MRYDVRRVEDFMTGRSVSDTPRSNWRLYSQICRFLNGRGYDPNMMTISAYPMGLATEDDVKNGSADGAIHWWAYDHRFEGDEPEDNSTNYIHADSRFEFYGIKEYDCEEHGHAGCCPCDCPLNEFEDE